MQIKFEELALDQVYPSPTNPRKRFDETELNELAASIREHGVMQAILVRPIPGLFTAYEIVAGERRWRASKLANKETIPVCIRDLSDIVTLQMQIIENSQRSDLHDLEEAKGFKALLDNKDAENWSADQLAEKIGKSRTYIYNSLKLNELCIYAQDMFLDMKFGRETALLIARIPGEKLQTEATKKVMEPDWQGNRLTFKEARKVLRNNFTLKLDSAPFKTTDPDLLPAAGSCKTCPSRSGNAQEAFPDIENADVCTNPTCFNDKKAAHIEQLKFAGSNVIEGAEAKRIMPHSYDLHKDYVKLEANCPGKAESIQKVLGNDAECVLTIVDPDDGQLVKVAKKIDVTAALQAKGIEVVFTAVRDYSAEEKEKERQFKIENAYRRELMKEVSISLKANIELDCAFEGFEETIIARSMLESLDHESGKRLLKLLNIPFTTEEGPYKARKALLESIADMTTPERMVLMMQLALIGEIHANEYSAGAPENLNQVAEHYGIDHTVIRTSTLEQFAPKTKAKKPPETSPTPLPAAQAQEIKGEDPANLIETPADDPGQVAQTSVNEDIAPGALPDLLPAETAVDPSPAAQAGESNTAGVPLSGFEKAKLKGEKAAARRKATQDKKVSAQADAQTGADQVASADHTH